MKNLLLTLVLLASSPLFAQNTNNISSTKTANHINIPGTRLYIIPPPGFTLSSSFTGLQKGENNAIQIMDMIGGDFSKNAATFSKEKFEGKGMKVLDYKEFKLNEYSAKYAVYNKPNTTINSTNLVFGDNSFSTLAMAVYPAADEKIANEIKQAIYTIYYDKNTKIDPFATAAFKLDETRSKFKFANSSAGLFIYTIDGKDDEDSNDKALVLVTTVPTDGTRTAKDLSDMSLESLQKKGFTLKSTNNTSADNVNGYEAYQTEVMGMMNGKECMLYQMVLKGKVKSIIIQGLINSDMEANLREIKALAQTIKLK